MMRIVNAVCMALVLSLSAIVAQAQDDEDARILNEMVNDAFGKLTDLQEAYFDVRSRLADWENALDRSGATTRTGVARQPGNLAASSAYQQLATTIINHPMTQSADAQCRDYLGALLLPNVTFEGSQIQACARTIPLKVRHREDLECSSLYWVTEASGKLRLVGHVEDGDDLVDLAQKFGRQTVSTVVERPFPGCAALTALELPMTSENPPKLKMLSNKNRIAYTESLAFEVVTPDFYSFMYIIYLQADGAIFNLTPRRGIMRQQHAPRTRLVFGDGRDGRQTYTAQAPAGDEAVIAIAARSPIDVLDNLERRDNGQYDLYNGRVVDQTVFLEILGDSLNDEFEAARGRREISAEVLHLTIVP